MSFSAPIYLFFLLSIPGLIILYMLKKKYTEEKISSLYLWERALRDIEVTRPWQKLRKNFLLLLEILALLFLVFGLSGPYIFSRTGSRSVAVVMDVTGSMNYNYKNTTRFDAAREEALDFVNSLSPSSKVSLITYGLYPSIELNDGSRGEAAEILKGLKPTSYGGNFEETLPFVKSFIKEKGDAGAYFFTDSSLSLEGLRGEASVFSTEVDNVSLEFLSHSRVEESYKAVVRVVNRGKSTVEREITLLGDDKVMGIKPVTLEAGETKSLFFEGIPLNTSSLKAELAEEDDLPQDNEIYDVIKSSDTKKVYYLGEKNVFIEKAFSLFKNVEFYKSKEGSELPEGYDIYILDGMMPGSLPKTGSLLIINPPEDNDLIKVKGSFRGGEVEVLKTEITKFMEGTDFAVSELLDLEPRGLETAVKSGNSPLCLFGRLEGRMAVVMAFELHNSDFALKESFPIFIHNIISYLTDTGALSKPQYLSGERIEILPHYDAKEAALTFPSGKNSELKLMFPTMAFSETQETGIYSLSQKSEGGEYRSIFAVNFPPGESRATGEGKSTASGGNATSGAGTRDIQFLLLTIALIALLAEWGVLVHES